MPLAKSFLKGTGVLIGVYLAVSYYTGAGRLLAGGTNAYVAGVRVLQGR